MSNTDYSADIAIDFNNLHQNWRDNPSKYMHYSQLWTDAVTVREQRRKFLNNDIRTNPKKYGFIKAPAEAGIAVNIEVDTEYIQLNKDVMAYASAKAAFDHRRSALDGLTRLFLAGYFARDESPVYIEPTLKKEVEQRVGDAQRIGLNKNSRMLKRKSSE